MKRFPLVMATIIIAFAWSPGLSGRPAPSTSSLSNGAPSNRAQSKTSPAKDPTTKLASLPLAASGRASKKVGSRTSNEDKPKARQRAASGRVPKTAESRTSNGSKSDSRQRTASGRASKTVGSKTSNDQKPEFKQSGRSTSTGSPARPIPPPKLAWPVSGRITQAYGERVNPATKTVTLNPGINISAVGGSKVRAAASGRVTLVSWLPSYGTFIIVEHSGGFRTVYANLASSTVRRGATVKTGERIGFLKAAAKTAAKSGKSFLHFETWRGQVRLDPVSLLR